ncbi:MAG: pantothenate kinase [Leptolyngbyaceae cyanobacterium]
MTGRAQNSVPWLALVIGNTRLHWAAFDGDHLCATWHTSHLTSQQVAPLLANLGDQQQWIALGVTPPRLPNATPLYLASVVGAQAELWQDYPHLHTVALERLPLRNLYSTLGIDRALNLLGAGDRYGWPVLVVDGGTALTFTAGDDQTLIGGAILPGMGLQFKALGTETAELPDVHLAGAEPPRWADSTADAIRSGVFWGQRAAVLDAAMTWWQEYPQGNVVITGGDGPQIYASLETLSSKANLHHDPELAFLGIKAYRRGALGEIDLAPQ